jgi:hypothetical protein
LASYNYRPLTSTNCAISGRGGIKFCSKMSSTDPGHGTHHIFEGGAFRFLGAPSARALRLKFLKSRAPRLLAI